MTGPHSTAALDELPRRAEDFLVRYTDWMPGDDWRTAITEAGRDPGEFDDGPTIGGFCSWRALPTGYTLLPGGTLAHVAPDQDGLHVTVHTTDGQRTAFSLPRDARTADTPGADGTEGTLPGAMCVHRSENTTDEWAVRNRHSDGFMFSGEQDAARRWTKDLHNSGHDVELVHCRRTVVATTFRTAWTVVD